MGDRFNFLDMAVDYARFCSDVPENFAEVIALQVLCHALGHETTNAIEPFAVYHNVYSLLVGESTKTRKTTTQDLFKMIYPSEREMPANEMTPESLMETLSEQNEGMWWMGEFTKMLRGIKSGNYLASFAETLNDLFSCQRYVRKLRSGSGGKKNLFEINKPFLSVSSTVTPDVLYPMLNIDMARGGLMARYLLVNCAKPKNRKRRRLKRRSQTIRNQLRQWIKLVLSLEKNVTFVLSDDALEYYNNVVEEECKRPRYSAVGAYAGRYQNYVVAFADAILVGEALGALADSDLNSQQLVGLVELVKLVELVDRVHDYEAEQTTNCTNPTNPTNSTNPNVVFVQKRHVERAWQIIKPCLEYAREVMTYVDMGKYVSKPREYIRKHKGQKVPHSDVLRMTNLSAKELHEGVKTLQEREEIKVIQETRARAKTGFQYRATFYEWIGD